MHIKSVCDATQYLGHALTGSLRSGEAALAH